MPKAKGEIAKRMERLFAGETVAGLSEGELLRRFATGRDETAFEAIARRHGPMVLAVCRRVLDDPRDVEDSFQAVFLVLLRKAARLRDPDRLGPWLHAVATKVALRARSNNWKRRRREVSSQAALDSAPSGGGRGVNASEHHEADWLDLRPVLDQELTRLPEKYRAPIVLCHLEGLTHEQAAARLQWPVGTVRGRLSRGRDLLRTRLTRRGLAFSTALFTSMLAERAAPAANISDALLSVTFQSFSRVAVSAAALTLAEGVLSTMFMTKLRVVLTGVLAVGVVSTGAAVFGRQLIQDAKPNQDPKKAESRVAQAIDEVKKADGEGVIVFDDSDRDGRLDRLGGEADTLSAEIEILQIEVDAIKQRLQQSVPVRTDYSRGFAMMGGGMGGGIAFKKPKNEEEKKQQDEAREKYERQQEEFKRQQEEYFQRSLEQYKMLKDDFLEKSVKLGGMRRRLEKINGQLAFRPNQPPAAEAKTATAGDMDLKHRLNVIERKVDELKQTLDRSGINAFQQKMNAIDAKLDALKK